MRNEHDGGKYRRTGLKVVLDTNVYISAFHSPKDVCAELVEYAAKGYYELIVSPIIVREFARATRRDFQVDERKHLRFMKFLGKRGKSLSLNPSPTSSKKTQTISYPRLRSHRQGKPHRLPRPRPVTAQNVWDDRHHESH
jgi:hypothetical protein